MAGSPIGGRRAVKACAALRCGSWARSVGRRKYPAPAVGCEFPSARHLGAAVPGSLRGSNQVTRQPQSTHGFRNFVGGQRPAAIERYIHQGGRGGWETMPVREGKKRWQAAGNRIP